MINDVGATEGQVDNEKNLHGGMQDAPNPGHHHKELAEPLTHDGRVVQRLAGGHVVVIGHDCQKEKCCDSKKSSKKYLTSTGNKPLMAQMIKHLPAMQETQV